MAAHPGGAAPGGPDPRLVAAAAMVFVDDAAEPVLSAADTHHLLDVLRLRPGEAVVASDGAGWWVPCRIGPATATGRGPDPAEVLVVDGEPVTERRLEPALTVAFAPAKGDRPEWVVQKLTELGIDRIVPVTCARSVVRWEGERARRAVERLRRVAREAAAQCRRVRLPEVDPVATFDGLGEAVGVEPCLAHPGGPPPSLAAPVVVIGPEGGWEEAELDRYPGTVGLGPTVLRAETAAVTAGALLGALRSGVVGPLA